MDNNEPIELDSSIVQPWALEFIRNVWESFVMYMKNVNPYQMLNDVKMSWQKKFSELYKALDYLGIHQNLIDFNEFVDHHNQNEDKILGLLYVFSLLNEQKMDFEYQSAFKKLMDYFKEYCPQILEN